MNTKQAQAEVSKWEAKAADFQRQLADASQKLNQESDTMGEAILGGADATQVGEKVAVAEKRHKGLTAAMSLANQELAKARASLAEAQKEEGLKKIAELKAKHHELAKGVVAKYSGLLDQYDAMLDLQREITQTQAAFKLPVQLPDYARWAQEGVSGQIRLFFDEADRNYPGLWATLGIAKRVIKEKFLRSTGELGVVFLKSEEAPDAIG